MRHLLLIPTLLLTLVLGACRPEAPADPRPTVVVSVLPQAYFVERIGGDRVQIAVMVPPGASYATYEPTFKQLKALAHSELYIKVGHPNFAFERTWLNRILEQNQQLVLVDGSEGLDTLEGDPHVWVSPDQVRRIARNIATALSRLRPADKPTFDANLASFLADIDALDKDLNTTLAPHKGKKFFVFHPAWGYFARQYGLQQVAIEESGNEPSPKELARIVDQAREANVHVIFVQPQFSTRSADIVAHEIHGKVVTVDPLARDWLGNMKQVQVAFARALEGQAHE